MPPSEAQRKAVMAYRERQAAAGKVLRRLWITKEADAALANLAKVHGSKDKAVEAAILAMAADADQDAAVGPPFTDAEIAELQRLANEIVIDNARALVLADARTGRVEVPSIGAPGAKFEIKNNSDQPITVAVAGREATVTPGGQKTVRATGTPPKGKKAATDVPTGLAAIPVARGRLVKPK